MIMEETLVAADPGMVGDRPQTNSADWWRARSAEELREFLDRGFGSAGFDEATVEAERRARERRRAEDQAVQAAASHKKSLRLGMLEGLLLACLVALIAILLIR